MSQARSSTTVLTWVGGGGGGGAELYIFASIAQHQVAFFQINKATVPFLRIDISSPPQIPEGLPLSYTKPLMDGFRVWSGVSGQVNDGFCASKDIKVISKCHKGDSA